MKTGSTDDAKYCVSATAEKNGLKLIAVVMGAPDHKIRFEDAKTLLNYGFGKCQVYTDPAKEHLPRLAVQGGVEEQTALTYESDFSYLDVTGADFSQITKELELPAQADAPISKGKVAGRLVYKLNGKEIGSVNVLFGADVRKALFKDYFLKTLGEFCMKRDAA